MTHGKEAEYWDGVARSWQQSGRDGLWRAYSDRLHAALLERWLPAGTFENILKTDLFDEAVSGGLYPLLAARAKRFTGVDISAAVIAAAKSRHPGLEAVEADVRKLPFEGNAFDLVISDSTLDHFRHVSDIVTALRELHRVLRPGGRMILTLDNLANPIIALRNALPFGLLNRLGVVPYYVGRTLGPGGVRRGLEEAGFRIVEMTGLMHCPRVFAVAASRLLERRPSKEMREKFLTNLLDLERLSRWPTRFLTGHFIAAHVIKEARA